MAFREVGVKFVQRGLTTFAREVDRANRAIQAMTRVQIQNAKANVQAAQAIDRVAVAHQKSMVSSLNAVHKALERYSEKITDARIKLNMYGEGMGSIIPAYKGFTNIVDAVIKKEGEREKQLAKLTSLDKIQGKELGNTKIAITNLTKSLATLYAEGAKSIAQQAFGEKATQGQINAVKNAIQAFVEYRMKLAETGEAIDKVNEAQVETARTGEEVKRAQGFWEGLRVKAQNLRESFQGIQTAVGAVIGVFNAVTTSLSMVGQAIGTVVGIISKVLSVVAKITGAVLKVAFAIGKTLFNAIMSIVKIPFNIIKKGFDAIVGSIQRILEVTIGMNLSRILWGIGRNIRGVAEDAYNASVEFQLTQIRIEGLLRRELTDQGYDLADAIGMVGVRSKELLDWVSELAVSSIYGAEDINRMFAYAMSFRFTAQEAKDLTEASLNFATGMGLTDTEMTRIIENFGQMRQQGKLAGTELRDLARGAFLPISDILKQMGVRLDLISDISVPSIELMTKELKKARSEGEITDETFRNVTKAIDEMSYHGSISATALMKLYNSGVLTEDIFNKMGTSLEAINTAASDLKLDEVRNELNRMISEGETSVDEFFWAFMDIVDKDFSGAMDNAAATMKHAIGNVHDYIETMFGWRLLTPMTSVVADRINKMLENLMSDAFKNMYDAIGRAGGILLDMILTISDIALPLSFNLESTTGFVYSITNFFEAIANIKGDWATVKDFLDNSMLFLWKHGLSREGTNKIAEGFREIYDTVANLDSLDFETIKNNLISGVKTIWEPLWSEVIKPKIVETMENIKDTIVTYWEEQIKPKLADFLENVMLPALNTFINETIPSWANTLAIEAPKIAKAINENLLSVFTNLSDWAKENTGEKSALSLFLELLKSLTKYVGLSFKSDEIMFDPHAPWQEKVGNNFEQSGLAKSLRDIADAVNEATEPLKEFLANVLEPLANWADNKGDGFIAAMDSMAGLFERMVTSGATTTLLAVVDLARQIFSKDENKESNVFLWRLLGFLTELTTLSVDLYNFPFNVATDIIKMVTEFVKAFREIKLFSTDDEGKTTFNLGEILSTMFEGIQGLDLKSLYIFKDIGEIFKKDKDGPLRNFFDGLDGFIDYLKGAEEEITAFGNYEGGNVKAIFNDQFEETVKKAEWMKEELIGASIIPDMVDEINSYLNSEVPGMEKPFITSMNNIVSMINNKIPVLKNVGIALLAGFLDGLKLKFAEILVWWEGALNELNNITRTINEIRSPSKLYQQFGEYIMEGFKEGLSIGMLDIRRELAGSMAQSYGLLTSPSNHSVTNNSYRTSMDNRNIVINMSGAQSNGNMDYDYIRAITR